MIKIRVLTYNGQPPAQALACDFDAQGGSIGRAETNQLVLPDPARHISRVQARVVYRNGRFEIINQGANPVVVNGHGVANGMSIAIGVGDRIEIGGYRLEAAAVTTPADAAPVTMQNPYTPPTEAPVPAPAARPVAPPRVTPVSAPVDDPLGLFGGAAPPAGGDPFADLLRAPANTPAPAAKPMAPLPPGRATPVDDPLASWGASAARGADSYSDLIPAGPPPAADPFGGLLSPSTPPKYVPSGGTSAAIPDDFDPFADPFAQPPRGAAAGVEPLDDLDFGLGGQAATPSSIDAMYGLGSATPAGAPDPFAGGALGEPAPRTESGGLQLDPLAALSGAAPGFPPASQPDQVPELRGAYVPPAPHMDPLAAPAPGAFAAPAGDSGSFFQSWDDGGAGISKTTIESRPAPRPSARPAPGAPRADPLLAMFGEAAPAARPAPPIGDDPLTGIAAPAAAYRPAAPAPAAESDALARAFLAGLGVPTIPLPQGMTPEMMERVGRLLREATQGTLDLLLARAMTKREVRAEATMIVGRDNNPLKFSPDVSVALSHLVAPQGRGFLPPVEAMRDAYDDLRSHQFGFMAGLRAALAGVLKRFDPGVLEQRLTEKSMLDSLLSMNRRAKLWDLYTELYGDIASEAEDDFHTLFGREFLRAYEEQVARLEQPER